MYRDRNRAVRTTPAPVYFDTYPEFNELRQTRLDLGDLQAVLQQAEQHLAQNRKSLAELQEKILDEQTATIDALLTMVSSAERRATQQINKDDAISDARLAQRVE